MSSRHKLFFSPSAPKKETLDKFNEKHTLHILNLNIFINSLRRVHPLSLCHKKHVTRSHSSTMTILEINRFLLSTESTERRSPDRLVPVVVN